MSTRPRGSDPKPPAPRPRGRPRSFDPDLALDRAAEVFWTRGLSAASLDDLCAAMEIARPSLYAAFGDKEDLYLAATNRFREQVVAIFRRSFAAPATARDGMEAYFKGVIALYTRGPTQRGCIAYCTATTEAASHPRIREVLASLIVELDGAFTALLRRARDRGEIDGEAEPAVLGPLLAATQHSLAIRARAGVDATELEKLARAAITVVFGAKGEGKKRAK